MLNVMQKSFELTNRGSNQSLPFQSRIRAGATLLRRFNAKTYQVTLQKVAYDEGKCDVLTHLFSVISLLMTTARFCMNLTYLFSATLSSRDKLLT